jgi:hypothetical protein
MRYLILVKATPDTEAERFPPGEEMRQLLAEIARFHEDLHKAGALLDASGLKPSSKGWRVAYSGSQRVVLQGPFPETKDLIAGYTLIQAKSREEALEWSRRFPNPAGEGRNAQIEVRELEAP